MDKEEGNYFSGIIDENKIESVRAIEDGPVRTIIEAVMKYDNSFICIRYHLPKRGTQVKVTVRVYWNEKMKMLKLSIPTTIENACYTGQQAYGSEQLLTDGNENVSHKWNILYNKDYAVSVINDCTYGSDVLDGEIRISLLRSAAMQQENPTFRLGTNTLCRRTDFHRIWIRGKTIRILAGCFRNNRKIQQSGKRSGCM